MADTSANGGERQYQDRSGSYILPNDSQEHDRLDTQSDAFVAMMNGQPFHAPVSNPKRILDIGCGTGAMTARLARKYPDAEVIGVDISPVPARHHQPGNLTYVQGNIMELAKSNDSRFQPGSFDYVFHRLLVLGMTNWPDYVGVVHTLLRPEGWAEMQDIDIQLLKADGSSATEGWWFYDLLKSDCSAIGLDLHIGGKLAQYMRDVGLTNVEETLYKRPLRSGELEGEAKEKEIQRSMANNRELTKRVSGARRTAEEVDEMCQAMEAAYRRLEPGVYGRLFVVVGLKAE